MLTRMRTYPCLPRALRQAVFMLLAAVALAAHSETKLADQPIFTATDVPGNLALALSVEYPTAVSVAHSDSAYSTETSVPYLGYFDPDKCYEYVYVKVPSGTNLSHFKPIGKATQRTCRGAWSGNFLNWATTQTIDPFRWALTGGYRVVDTKDLTIIEKAYASGQGGTNNFPNRTLYGSTLVAGATPWSAGEFRMRIQGLGARMRFTVEGDPAGGDVEALSGTTNITGDQAKKVFEVYVRVKVCDESVGLESNCKRYPSGYWKPEGLIQKYADRIRLSAFGYLNDDNLKRDGGVLRARQKFVGPQISIPGRSSETNLASEWDSDTGVFTLNPDSKDADNTALLFGVQVANSGVINYLNKFGASGSYKTHDPVGELYYAALRYFRKLGNVPAYYSAPDGTGSDTKKRWVDGFPVIAEWDDPIQYTCQKNFVLGIGDVNTHADKNVPGATGTADEPTKPGEVAGDTTVDAVKATNQVGKMQGLGDLAGVIPYNGCCNSNSALMAGLAYEANTTDIRPDLDNPSTMPRGQSVRTYWLDVQEYQEYKLNNQFYLAAKYGGFQVPKDFQPYGPNAALEESWWHNNSDMLRDTKDSHKDETQPRPDTYFTASRPDQVVQGLSAVFADIASQLRRDTTSFATPSARVPDSTGIASFSAKYNAENWTGEVEAGLLGFTSTTDVKVDKKWSLTDKMEAQFAGSGWSSDTSPTGGRRVVTWNTKTQRAVAFRYDDLSAAQRSALDSPYRNGDDGAELLNYLRGDRSLERLPSTSGRPYRYRVELLGDIAGSRLTVVGPPNRDLSMNEGYGAFKEKWKARPTVVYFGANDGMLHAINGSVIEKRDASGNLDGHEFGSDAGKEIFAYVPGQLFQGPSGTPGINGLAALGNPSFAHYAYVNATPISHEIDFAWTYTGENPDGKSPNDLDPRPAPDWHTVLIGGLGKGGRSYYAIDVTDPASMTSESAVAGKVLWEFTDEDMGYTYGAPTVAKTDKYGWVVILPSGYNNKTGKGYFFIIHPVTGKLLEKVSTGEGSVTRDAGLAHANAFAFSLSDGKTDAAYAGDLLGNVWRWDLRGRPGSYPAPVKIAQLTDDKGNLQPITSRPMIEYSPLSKRRHVLVGTGRLLDSTDIVSSQQQSFYSLGDGSLARFDTTGPFPRTRSDLTPVTDLTSGSSEPTNWYIDLGTETIASGPDRGMTNAWRVTDPAVILRQGPTYAAFAAVLPTGDACEPSGHSRVYAINVATGQSALEDGSPYFSVSGIVIDMKHFLVGAKTRFLVGTDSGQRKEIKLRPSSSIVTTTNWREIPVAD